MRSPFRASTSLVVLVLLGALLASDVVNVGVSASSGNTIEGIFGRTLLLSKNTSYWVVLDAQESFDGA